MLGCAGFAGVDQGALVGFRSNVVQHFADVDQDDGGVVSFGQTCVRWERKHGLELSQDRAPSPERCFPVETSPAIVNATCDSKVFVGSCYISGGEHKHTERDGTAYLSSIASQHAVPLNWAKDPASVEDTALFGAYCIL